MRGCDDAAASDGVLAATTSRALRRSILFWPALAVAILTSLAGGGSAFAAPPTNDDFDQATLVSGLPFTHSISTAQATVARDDPMSCESGNASVWYRYTAPAAGMVEADTIGSEYDTTLSVWIGARGHLSLVICNDDIDPD